MTGFLSAAGTVLLWIAGILVGIIIILFLFSLPKIRVILGYNGELSVKIKFLFFKIDAVNKDKKKSGKAAPSDSAQEKKQEKEKKEKKPLPSFLKNLTFADYIELVKIAFRDFIFKIRIENLDLDAKISGDNAADTAMQYGKISAALYPVAAFLSEKKVLEKANINVRTDFLAEKSEYRGKAVFYTRLITLIKTAISAFIYLLKRDSRPEK